jgi:hypothetical protein
MKPHDLKPQYEFGLSDWWVFAADGELLTEGEDGTSLYVDPDLKFVAVFFRNSVEIILLAPRYRVRIETFE